MLASPTRGVPLAAQQRSARLGLLTKSLTLAPLDSLQLQLRLLRNLHQVPQHRFPPATPHRRPHILRVVPRSAPSRPSAHPGRDNKPRRRHPRGRMPAPLWTKRRTRPTTWRVHGRLRPPTHLASTALQPARPHRIKTSRRLRRLSLYLLPFRVVRAATAAWAWVRRRREGGGHWASSSRGSPRARPSCRGVIRNPPP